MMPTGGLHPTAQQQHSRHARRLYVGGLPDTATNASIQDFFSMALEAVDGAGEGLEGEPVINVYVNHEKKFAFVEYRTGTNMTKRMDTWGQTSYIAFPLLR